MAKKRKKAKLPMGKGKERQARRELLEAALKILVEKHGKVPVFCRSCNKPMDRETRAGHKVWYVCANLFCEKNQKKPGWRGR